MLVCAHTWACVRVCMFVCNYRGQKRMVDPLELELQEVVSCPRGWILVWESKRHS